MLRGRGFRRADGYEDFRGVFDGGRLIAMGWIQRRETAEPVHWMESDGCVHPDDRGRGIGTRLVRWQAESAPRIHEHYFPGSRLELSVRLSGTNTAAHELFEHEGFTPIRWSFAMRRPADAESPTAAVGVYERSGFEAEREFVFYNKKLR